MNALSSEWGPAPDVLCSGSLSEGLMMTVILDLLRPAGRETAPDPPVTTRKPCRASRLAKIVPAREICRENVRLGNASPLVQIWRPWQRPAIIQWRRRKKTRLAPADARKKPRQNSRKKKTIVKRDVVDHPLLREGARAVAQGRLWRVRPGRTVRWRLAGGEARPTCGE